MRIAGKFALGALSLLFALSLAGCLSFFPKTPPAQLWRFTHVSVAPVPNAAEEGGVGVVLGDIGFPRQSEGHRILTVNGGQAAYIAGSRWVATASDQFRQAAYVAFERQGQVGGGAARLLAEGEIAPARWRLQLDVRRFDVDLTGNPVIEVEVAASLSRIGGAPTTFAKRFAVRTPAGEDRVGAMVGAFDEAVTTVLSQIAAWTNAQLASSPPPASAAGG
ncbi:MAG: ABC-type transport auxiliary lipoprotein family protein [Caulobacteraceae bacterium]